MVVSVQRWAHGLRDATKRRLFWWYVLWCAVALVLASFGHVIMARLVPTGGYYLGYGHFYNSWDVNAYLMKILQGMQGKWLYESWYTSESFGALPVNTFYLALGQAGKLFTQDPRLIFHAARLVTSGILLSSTYMLLRAVLPSSRQRALVFPFLVLSSSFVWLIWDHFQYVESNTFYTLGYAPHFILGMALVFLLMRELLVLRTNQTVSFARTFVLALTLALVYPFSLLAVGASFGVFLLWSHFQASRDSQRRILVMTLIVGAVTVGLWLFYRYLGSVNDFARAWLWEERPSGEINYNSWLLTYGLAVPVILWQGLKQPAKFLHPPDMARRLLYSWFWGMVLVVMPLSISGERATLGWQFPVMVLAFLITREAAMRYRWSAQLKRRMYVAMLALALFSSMAYVLRSMHMSYVVGRYYLSHDQFAIMRYLKDDIAPGAVVLSQANLGNYIPAVSGQKVVIGHQNETLAHKIKSTEVVRFFDRRASDLERLSLIEKYQVDYVITEGVMDGDALPIEDVFSSGIVHLYRVRH